MQYYCANCGKPCGKTYSKAFRSGKREDNYLCKSCWEQQRKDAADFVKGVGYLLVHLILPLIGIVAIIVAAFVGCGIALEAISEKFGLELANTTRAYIHLGTVGAVSLLTIPLVVKVLKTLWKMWVETSWLFKVIFCIICPALLVLVVLQFLLKLFRR